MERTDTERQIRIIATNGTDSNLAFILNEDNDKLEKEKEKEKPNRYNKRHSHTYYQNHKLALLEYAHGYYARNRQSILLKKKLTNAKPETKDRKRQYNENHYLTHKKQITRQQRKYRINKNKKLKLG